MFITCEDCNTRFQLDDSRMKEGGVKVKCSKCGKIFKAYTPSSVGISATHTTGMKGFDEELAENEDNGLDFSEMEKLLSSGEGLDLDIASDEYSGSKNSGFGFDETNELDLSDMDQLFEDDEVAEAGGIANKESEEIDFNLEDVQEKAPSLGGINGESEEIEELDLLEPDEEIEELDLELAEENDSAVSEIEEEKVFSIDGETLGIEKGIESEPADRIQGLGLFDTEMKDISAAGKKTDEGTLKSVEEDTEFSFDFEKDLEAGEISETLAPEEIEPEEDVDEIEELGLTDIEEMFTLEEDQESEEIEIEEAVDLEIDEAFEFPEDTEDIEPDAKDISVDFEAGDEVKTEESPEDDADEFGEFGLTDLEEMFNLEAEPKPEKPEPVLEDSRDVEFGDEAIDDGDTERFEFKLDEATAVLDGSGKEEVGVEFEEYEELDLSELDEMFDKEEVVVAKKDVQKEELGDLDFGIDMLPKTGKETTEPVAEKDLGIADTSELDFSDIGEMLESEEELDLPETAGIVEDESDLDFGFGTKTLVDEKPKVGMPAEASADKDDFGLSGDAFDLSSDDLDLSEMEKMLQETDNLDEDISPAQPSAPVTKPSPKREEKEEPLTMKEDLDFGLDEEDAKEDFFKTEETQDIELEFGVEEEEEEKEAPPLKPAEMTEKAKAKEDDIEATYDMGLELDKIRKKAAEKIKGTPVAEKTLTPKKSKPVIKGKPIPFEKKKKHTPALVALLIIILAVGVPIALTNMGIKIPYLSDFISSLDIEIPFADKIQQANIPYISDMVKSGEQDVQGISKITIVEPSIDGYYVENANAGVLFVISGQVRNDYDQPRSFINVKGQIYSKGKANSETRTAFAGNMLAENELAEFDTAAIDKRLNQKYGDKKSNVNIPKGNAVPFMIIFTKIPDELEGYDVEVAGSTLFQAEAGKK